MPIVIPKRGSICPAVASEPFNMTIYGYPGMGKTPAVAMLPDSVIIDCQITPGTKYVSHPRTIHVVSEAEREGMNPHEAFVEILKQWLADPSTFLIIDPITEIVEWAETKATDWFHSAPIGQGDKGQAMNSILEMKGRDENSGSPGWMYLRKHFMLLMKEVWARRTTRTIFVGHVRDAMLAQTGEKGAKTGILVDDKDLDLPGKLKYIFLSENDAAAYMFRDAISGTLKLTFAQKKGEAAFLKCRCPRLLGKTFDFHTPVTVEDWRQIYPETMARLLSKAAPAVAAPIAASQPTQPATSLTQPQTADPKAP